MAKKKTTKKKAPKGKSSRTRQGILPNTIPEPTVELIDLAEELEGVRDERLRLQDEESELQQKVIDLMHGQKIEKLELASGRVAVLTKTESKEKIKLQKPKSED